MSHFGEKSISNLCNQAALVYENNGGYVAGECEPLCFSWVQVAKYRPNEQDELFTGIILGKKVREDGFTAFLILDEQGEQMLHDRSRFTLLDPAEVCKACMNGPLAETQKTPFEKTTDSVPLSYFHDVIQELFLKDKDKNIVGMRACETTLVTDEAISNAMSACLPDDMEEDEMVADIEISYRSSGLIGTALLVRVKEIGDIHYLYRPDFRVELPIFG